MTKHSVFHLIGGGLEQDEKNSDRHWRSRWNWRRHLSSFGEYRPTHPRRRWNVKLKSFPKDLNAQDPAELVSNTAVQEMLAVEGPESLPLVESHYYLNNCDQRSDPTLATAHSRTWIRRHLPVVDTPARCPARRVEIDSNRAALPPASCGHAGFSTLLRTA